MQLIYGVPSEQERGIPPLENNGETLEELMSAANASPLLESPNPAQKVHRNFAPASENVNRGRGEVYPDLLASRVVDPPLPLFRNGQGVAACSRTLLYEGRLEGRHDRDINSCWTSPRP